METLLFLLHQCQARITSSGLDAGDWLTAVATLTGAAGGAGVGAWGAYRSTVKANNQALRREKLEEILTQLHKLKIHDSERLWQLSEAIGCGDRHGYQKLANELWHDLDPLAIARLHTLVDVNLADHLDEADLLDRVHYEITEAVKAFRRGHNKEERHDVAQHFEILAQQLDASVTTLFEIVCNELRDR